MSLKLNKGASKFKPKVAPKRPGAASAQSSARPSVERQSQTPIPTSYPEIIQITDQTDGDDPTREISDSAAAQAVVVEAWNAQHTHHRGDVQPLATSLPTSSRPPDPTKDTNAPQIEDASASAGESTLKRKERGERGPDVAQKRTRTEPDIPQAQPEILQEAASGQVAVTLAPDSVQPTIVLVGVEKSASPNPTVALATSVRTPLPIQRDAIEHDQSGQSRQASSEASQDNSQSLYPDPELSGNTSTGSTRQSSDPLASSRPAFQIIQNAPLIPDGTTAARIVESAALNPDGTPGAPISAHTTAKQKKAPRRRIQPAQEGDDARATIDVQLTGHRRAPGVALKPARAPRKRKEKEKEKQAGTETETGTEKKKRAQTPEDGEEQDIEASVMTIAELCEDPRIGRKSKVHVEVMEKAAQLKQKKQLDKAAELAASIERENCQREGTYVRPPSVEPEEAPRDRPQPSGPQTRIVDGQIVFDDATLQVNRHANIDNTPREVIVQDDFSKLVNSASNMKREKNLSWDFVALDTFYRGLRMFGTDFLMISKMLPGRSRRQIKLKFNKEEREHPEFVDAILKGKNVPIDLSEWQRMSGTKLESMEAILAQDRAIEEEQKKQEDAIQKEKDEREARKKADIAAGVGTGKSGSRQTEPSSGKENDGQKRGSAASKEAAKTKKANAKRKKNAYTNNDQSTEEVLGPISMMS